MQLVAAAQIDCLADGIVECSAAVRVCVSGGVIAVRTVINHFAAVGQGNACRTGQKQTIPERHIGGNRAAVCLLELFCVSLLGNLLGRTAEQRAVGVRKNHGQVQLLPLYAVVRRNFSGSLYLFLMLLSVRYRQRQHLVCAVLIHSKPQTGCAVYAAAEKNQCFHMIYPPRVIPAKRDPSGMRRRRFSLWFEMRRCGCHEPSCSCASR